MSRMAEPRKRMTYEEQRAARMRMESRRQNSQTIGTQRQSNSQAFGTQRQSNSQSIGSQRHRSSQTIGTQRHQSDDRPKVARGNVVQATSQRQAGGEQAAKRPPFVKIAIAVVLLIVVVFITRMCMSAIPINVTVNGTPYELRGSKTMQTAIKASGLPINPGDFISLKGVILEKSAGDPFLATVNGEEVVDPDYGLRDGDTITLTDGNDIVEDYTAVESPVPYKATIGGMGAIHKFERGTEGVLTTKTGVVSGEEVAQQTTDPVDTVCREYNVNTGMNKVVAFTFDDGPSDEYTASVLDILAENDAKATFFCIGTEVESYPNLVKREYDEGHQICTHSYDHADPVGGTDLGMMDAKGQVDEVLRGMKTITDVVGGEASRVVRMPGGNLDEAMVLNLEQYIDYEIGWNIDTEDWTLPGADAIYQQMIAVQPGQIVLCHDGGGDRSQTVEALRRAVPYLKEKGFTFVTMDELLKYPPSA